MTITNRVSLKSVEFGVTPIDDVVDAPTIGTAADVGTSRAYNNGAATVPFTPVATGGAATSFTAISTPGSFTTSGASSPLTVTGLASGTSYTFAVYGTNAAGTWSAVQSAASNSITATTVPQAPTVGTASVTNSTTVSLTFSAGATGGSAITSYSVVSSPSISLSTSGTTSPVTVTGTFAADQGYTFTIAAVNANGTSTASSASNSITPIQTPRAIYFSRASDSGRTITTLNANTDAVSSTLLMPVVRQNSGYGVSNSPTSGYFGSGYFNGGLANSRSSVDKIVYASETLSTVISSGATPCIQSAAMSNAGSAGYHAGGESGQTFSAINTIGKITYSNDTYSLPSGKTLPEARLGTAGMSNKGTAGYVVGGNVSSLIVKFTFSNETASNLSISYFTWGGGGTNNSNNPAAFSNSGTAGYGAAGTNLLQSIRKILFSNDTASTLSATISVGVNASNGGAAKGLAGYVAGGNASTGNRSTIDKLSFSNETTSVLSDRISHTDTTGMFSVSNEGTL